MSRSRQSSLLFATVSITISILAAKLVQVVLKLGEIG